MPTSRRLMSALAVATVALPLTTVVLAAPALAADWNGGQAHGYRWQPVPSAPSVSNGYGSPYGGSYGGGYTEPQVQQQSSTAALAGLDTSVATDPQEVGLVTISTVVGFDQGEAAGTGIVLSSDGVVVTNHHVVEGATSIEVTVVATGQTYTAQLLGASTRKDVAVLQLQDAAGLDPATVDATAVTVGSAVTAVGDAGGDAGSLTAAPGTVTRLERSITVADEETGGKHRLSRLIRISSDVIPGDSGGALRSADNDVVGMTVAASTGSTSATVNGYVIPIARVLKVEQAVLAGQTTGDIALGYSAFLGVQLDSRTDSTTIAGVVGRSPAAKAGLGADDTVTAVDGTRVSTGTELRAALAEHAVGDSVRVTWTSRDGASHARSTTLTEAPIA